MPLITCKECHGKISDQAQSCPHCGAVTLKKRSSNVERMDAVILLISFIAGLFLAGITATMFKLDIDEKPRLSVTILLISIATPPLATLVWSNRRKLDK